MNPKLKIDRRQRTWRLTSALILGGCAFLFSSYRMVEPDINAKVKVLFLYQISKYVAWPDDAAQKSFTIGLYGEYPELLAELNKLAVEKKRGEQPYIIVHFKKVADITPCHILYLTPGSDVEIAKVQEKIKAQSTLLVTDKEGMIQKGACINFFYEDNKQRFEISNENAKQHGLKISAKLSTIAKVID